LQPVITMIAVLVVLILAVGAAAVLVAKTEDRVTHAGHRHALT
jgi:hypothetical protein